MTGPQTFCFFNKSGSVRHQQDWNDPSQEKLWLYNLHYFDDLNAVKAVSRKEWHRALIRRWILQNPAGKGNGWDSYPTSIRIVNWIKWILMGQKPDAEMLHSLAVQARWLHKRLEYHLLGNHLFANAKALVFAGLYYQGQEAEDWLNTGLSILNRELPEQVLPDGGHFERSPMYHAIILEDLLDLLNMASVRAGCVADELTGRWGEDAMRMLSWFRTMTHPDTEIAFFNDAALGVASNLQQLLSYAERLGFSPIKDRKKSFEYLADSGYVRLEGGPAVVLLDVAPLGPDYLLSHAHADTLSFELSLFDKRVVVNSGTSLYGNKPERLRQRGTAAHSTVVVDGMDSSEVWGSFRVARRACVKDVLIANQSPEIVKIQAAHDGYSTLQGAPMHRRTWELHTKRMLILDEVVGIGVHQIELIFHIHPAVSVSHREQDGFAIADSNGQVLCTLTIEGEGQVNIFPSTYHPEFNMAIENLRITYRWSGTLPTRCTTNIRWAVA